MREFGRLAILGGDSRQRFVKSELLSCGYEVSSYGLGEADDAPLWETAVRGADAVLLPLPASEDGVKIRTPLSPGDEIRFSSLLTKLKPECKIFGGKIPDGWTSSAREKGFFVKDLFQSESLQMKNALLTAEGAIRLAMESLPVALEGSSFAVVGYGRIGKLLAEKLTLLGGRVFLLARKETALCEAEARHAVPLDLRRGILSAVAGLPSDCRVIFNTVPERIFSEEAILAFPKCLYMELASAPGGADPSVFSRRGLPYLLAGALPGKFYPESAGKIIAITLRREFTLQQ